MAAIHPTATSTETPKRQPRCLYAYCRKAFVPSKKNGKLYCCSEHRTAAWRLRNRAAVPALSRAFDLLNVPIKPHDCDVIIGKVKLEYIEDWLIGWVSFQWDGYDFIDCLSGRG